MGLTHDDVREILRIIDESDVDELSVETDGFSLHVRRGAGGDAPSEVAALPRATPEGAPPPSRAERSSAADHSSAVGGEAPAGAVRGSATAQAGASPQAADGPGIASSPPESQRTDGLVTIPSPMLGTFYRAEGPGAAPFVDIGDEVSAETTVCIIEVMKMMNSVPAGVEGVVEQVVADNAKLVEYGEPLFRIRPRAA